MLASSMTRASRCWVFSFFGSWGFVKGKGTLLARTAKSVMIAGMVVLCAAVYLANASDDAASATKKTSPAKTAHATSSTRKKPSSAKHRSPSASASKASTSHKTSGPKRSSKASLKRTKGKRVHGQQKIDAERARSIQEALIREHYLSGEPSGVWNQESEDAMRRYQSDHGWQTKEVPDSRALIRLGLGPSKDHLLNPDSAMTTTPDSLQNDPPRSQPLAPTSHSATPDVPAPTPVQGDSSPQ